MGEHCPTNHEGEGGDHFDFPPVPGPEPFPGPEPYPDPYPPVPEPTLSPRPESKPPQEIIDYVNDNFGSDWILDAEFNPAEMQRGTFDGENWYTQDGKNLTTELRDGGAATADMLIQHEQILSDLKTTGASTVLAKGEGGKEYLTVNYVVGDSIISLTFVKEPRPEPQPEPELIDDGDGLDTDELAMANSITSNTAEQPQPALSEVAVLTAQENAAVSVDTVKPAEIVAPQFGEAVLVLEEVAGDERGGAEKQIIVVDSSPLPSPPPQGEGIKQMEAAAELDDLELHFDVIAIKQAAIEQAFVVEQISTERLLVDVKGYEVSLQQIEQIQSQENETPDIFELTQTQEKREMLEPYLKEMNRHMDVSFSPESANGVTTIEDPTVADIRLAEKMLKQDLRNEQLFGGLTEGEFKANKKAAEREKNDAEEQRMLAQQQDRRMERRVFIEEQEEEDERQVLQAMKAAAGEALAGTGDKEAKNRGENNLNPLSQEIRMVRTGQSTRMEQRRVQTNSETVRAVETRTAENEDEFPEQDREVVAIERATGISITREIVSEQPVPEIQREVVQKAADSNPITQLKAVPSTVQREEALVQQQAKPAEIRTIEADTGIQIVLPETETSQSILSSVENTFSGSVISARSIPSGPSDELGNEPEYAPGNEALRLAA